MEELNFGSDNSDGPASKFEETEWMKRSKVDALMI